MANKIQISQPAAIFFGLLLMGSTAMSAYLYGKAGSSGSTIPVPAPVAGDQQAAAQPAAVTVSMDQLRGLFNGKNITFGKKDSKLIFVEFSDPSCPFCHVAAGTNRALNKQMGQQFILKADGGSYVAPVIEMKKLVDSGKAAMVWVYANGHGAGEMATKALYCAQEKGKFWQAHDLLMSDSGYKLINDVVKNDKAQAGTMADFLKSAMSASEMKNCLESGKYDDRLAADMNTAKQFGFNGTPSFFVNTQNFGGAYSYTDMEAAVKAAL